MKLKLKAPGTQRLKLKYDELLSSFAFNFNLSHYVALDYEVAVTDVAAGVDMHTSIKVGCRRLTL